MFAVCRLIVAAAIAGVPAMASAQTMFDLFASDAFGAFPHLRHSNEVISVHAPGADYTPFERLRYEARTGRRQVPPARGTPESNDNPDPSRQQPPHATNSIEVETSVAREVAFRCRTSIFHPQPDRTLATKTYQPRNVAGDNAREQMIRKALNAPAWRMDFTERSLRDVVAELQANLPFNVQVDLKAFEDAGLDLETPISKSITDVSLKSALRILFDDLDLTYLVTNETLLLTTKNRAAETIITFLYPLPWVHSVESVCDLLQNTVAPQTWTTVGGQGAIQPFGSLLVISQTEEVHGDVQALLEQIFEAEFSTHAAGEPRLSQTIVTRIYPVKESHILAELEAKTVSICNSVLAADGDPHAKVTAVGGRLIIQSASRPFHAYAAQIVTGLSGVETTVLERIESTSTTLPGLGAGPFGGMTNTGAGQF